MIAIVWFRQDLRLADNPAFHYACQHAQHIIPVFIDDPTATTVSQLGAASRVWLHHSLHALQTDLQGKGSQLWLRQGPALEVLQQLCAETGATHVLWNRLYEPMSIQRDKAIKHALRGQVEVHSFNASLLNEPWEVLKPDGTPYKVFTAFCKAMLKHGIDHLPLAIPAILPPTPHDPRALSLAELGLLPKIRWDIEMMAYWQTGEKAALQRLEEFLHNGSSTYKQERDFPANSESTSRLSAPLHFGEISPRQIVYQARRYSAEYPQADTGIDFVIREVGWREFAYHLLYHFPHTVEHALDERFERFPWADNTEALLTAWQQGRTGYPIVDAGMRELWQTGRMHNRVRMIAASLLTKNLLIPWQTGEKWFRDTLIDADLANNVLGWQWTAGCGADAAPYFRIFNPMLQSQKFDPDGNYIRRWVPELKNRSLEQIHLPRTLGENLKDYPLPIVDFKTSRERALALFANIKSPLQTSE